jgi:RNA 3'-terminal phosphate cyclase (ATP)
VIELDGSDGGGQLVRTALSLSALAGEPFRMTNVRGDRPNPGLKRQHRTCVEAVAALTDADVEGDAVGSETLRFDPGVAPGAAAPDGIAVDVGTAGSVVLVADTLLPLAVRLDDPVTASLTGGTDVRWSPSADYLRRVKLPLLRRVGLDAAVDVARRGFFPAGGGELDVDLRPSTVAPIELGGRDAPPGTDPTGDAGPETRVSVHAVAAADLDDGDAADRLADAAAADLADRGLAAAPETRAASVDAHSPGMSLTVAIGASGGDDVASDPAPRAGFVAYGGADDDPSSLPETAVDAAARWAATDAPVDAHLGDQLVVWVALAGGTVPVPRVTEHLRTNVDLVSAFGYDVSIEQHADGTPAVVAPPPR